jgi:hypothetical protein
MSELRVLRASRALKMAVDVGLVVGTIPDRRARRHTAHGSAMNEQTNFIFRPKLQQ